MDELYFFLYLGLRMGKFELPELEFLQNKFYNGQIQAINGFSQSTGWPSVVTVMGNWYSQAGRGLVMGIWSSCQSIGNILGK